MIEVRNLLFQPLTLHLTGGDGNLHLGPRQRTVIDSDKVSPELEQAAKRGLVSLTEKTATQPEPAPTKTAAKRARKGRN